MNRGIRTAVTPLLAAMFAVMSTPVFAQVVPENGGVLSPLIITINDDSGNQGDPHVDGDLAVYSNAINTLIHTYQDIRYYQFSTGAHSTVPQDPQSMNDLLSDIDQGRIAFTRVYCVDNCMSGHNAIMLFDTTTAVLQELAPDDASNRFGVALGAQTVAFGDYGLVGDVGAGEIVVLDLATSVVTRLTNDAVSDGEPAVSPDGNVVVWQHCITSANCDIYGASRSDGMWTVRALATTPFDERHADTNGSDVVFHRYDPAGQTGTNIVLVPVSGGSKTVIEIAGEQINASMRGSIIAFESRANEASQSDIYVLDRVSNKFFQITQTPLFSESLNDITVLPSGEVRLVWKASSLSNPLEGNIYGATFAVPRTNSAPTASAGNNQTVRPGTTVVLSGILSYDDNTPTNLLQYAWSFVSVPDGSTVTTLAGANTMTPSFTPDVSGDYVVRLVVTDQDGLSSPPSEVTIGENPPPTANAGPDQLVIVGHVVALAGAGADPDGDALTYAWALTGTPAGSTAFLTSPTLANATFIPDQPGVYAAQLTVSDLFGPGAPDSAQITAITATGYADSLIQEASRRILDLPASAVTNRGNQNALTQFLSHAVVALQSGDLIAARQWLEQAMSRTDGCALRGMPDGNGPSRDWITTCAAQNQVYPLLVDALAAIAP